MTLFIPGKAYAFGEYTVVRGGHAVILSTTRGLIFDIKESDVFTVESDHFGRLSEDRFPEDLHLKRAMDMAWRALDAFNVSRKPCRIIITSTLDEDGMSLGLGSSGAFVVGLIKALLSWHGIDLSSENLYKLAVLSHEDDTGLTSFGDYAVSAYASDVIYKKMDMVPKGNLPDMLEVQWPGLDIRPVRMPFPWTLVNVGEKKSSHDLVKAVMKDLDCVDDALTMMDDACADAIKAMTQDDMKCLHEAVSHAQDAFVSLSSLTQAPLRVPAYKALIDRARALGVSCKISGAGGGDNLICFGNRHALGMLAQEIEPPYRVFEGVFK